MNSNAACPRLSSLREAARHPGASFVVCQSFRDPYGQLRVTGWRQDVELELVRQLVCDEPIQPAGRTVEREQQVMAAREHGGNGTRIGLQELVPVPLRLEQDERHSCGQVVPHVFAHLSIRALCLIGNLLEPRFERWSEVQVEVIRGVETPWIAHVG